MLEQIFLFFVTSLAVYRLALMVSKETGPCRIFERIRALPEPNGCWSKGLSCFFCQSVWWAFTFALWLYVVGAIEWHLFASHWLGLSGAALIINEFGPKLD
jgi:hypothetical protein